MLVLVNYYQGSDFGIMLTARIACSNCIDLCYRHHRFEGGVPHTAGSYCPPFDTSLAARGSTASTHRDWSSLVVHAITQPVSPFHSTSPFHPSTHVLNTHSIPLCLVELPSSVLVCRSLENTFTRSHSSPSIYHTSSALVAHVHLTVTATKITFCKITIVFNIQIKIVVECNNQLHFQLKL